MKSVDIKPTISGVSESTLIDQLLTYDQSGYTYDEAGATYDGIIGKTGIIPSVSSVESIIPKIRRIHDN